MAFFGVTAVKTSNLKQFPGTAAPNTKLRPLFYTALSVFYQEQIPFSDFA
jgi:hypothetical protein